jgi:CO/xanthine dehydrogenase FAD-binding subunit
MSQPYPRLPMFKYIQPASPREAIDFLGKHADQSQPYAGGTDCFVQIRDRRMLPQYLVDLKSIKQLKEIRFDAKKGLIIGATANLNEIIHHPKVKTHYPILAQAAEEVGGYQLRNRATLVGNLCNASPCGDTIGACLVYGAAVKIIGPKGERTVELKDFFKDPGKTCLQTGEIATSLHLPIPQTGSKGVYRSIGRNKLGDLAIAAVTILGYPDKKNLSGYAFRITLTAVAPTVIFAVEAEEILKSKKIEKGTLEQAAKACGKASKPINDIRGSANYRRDMINMLALRGLKQTCAQLDIPLK